jgi:hypothetical protein
MAITMRDFLPAMGLLAEMLPMQRALGDEALAMAWETMPNAAKIHLTPESLAFAVKQRLMDPDPPKEQALHIALLRYVFPIERTIRRERGEEIAFDRALLENGPRADLRERMANPSRFHDPAPARQEQAPPPGRPRLSGRGGWWHPSQLTAAERERHLQRVEARMETLLAQGPDGVVRSGAQLLQGLAWYRRALEGFWPLEVDAGGVAAAWIHRNPADARKMLQDAMSGTEPALPAADAVAAGFATGVEVVGW